MKTVLKNTFVLTLVLACLTFAAYSFMLSGEFKTMDDDASIVSNAMIRSFANVKEVFASSFFGGRSYYRPLVSLSFMAEYRLFGLNALFYYLDNILLHVATALVLFLLLEIIFRRRTLSFAAALLFAIHPVHWEAVSNIPGRSILLCAFFSLTALYLYILARPDKGPRGIVVYLLALACFFLALLSKEAAGVLPLALLAYEIFLGRRDPRAPRIDWVMIVPFFLMDLIYVLIRVRLGITQMFYWPTLTQALLGFLTFLRSVLTFLRLLVFPVGLQFDRAQRLFTTLLDGQALATIVFFALLLAGCWRFRKRMSPEARFFFAWFWIGLLPVSQLVTTIGVQPGYISAAEHFLYIPSVGFFVLAVLLADGLYRRNRRHPRFSPEAFWTVAGIVYCFLFAMTVGHNIYSSHEVAMFERTLELNPRNVRIRTSLARIYAKHNRFDLAEQHYRAALIVDPAGVRARIGLGKALCDQGRLWEGIREYEKITSAGGLSALLEDNLRATLTALVIRHQRMLREDPRDPTRHYRLGEAYAKAGALEKAEEAFDRGIALEPDFKHALFHLGATYEALGDIPKAVHYYKVMLSLIAPKDDLDAEVIVRLREIYKKLSDNPQAAQYNDIPINGTQPREGISE